MRFQTIMLLSFLLTNVLVKAQTRITIQPSQIATVVCKGGNTVQLAVTAIGPPGSQLFYQWYKNTTNSYVNATPIANANSSTLNKVMDESGIFYLFCQVVPTVTYSTGKWMSENLSVVTYNNGDSIPLVTSERTWANLKTGAYCYPNNDPSQVATKGLLYNWYAVNDPRGIAPPGWKIPSKSDFESTSDFSGIDAVGHRSKNGQFFKKYSYWWCTTEDVLKTAYLRILYEGSINKNMLIEDKKAGLSIRCVKQ